MSLTHAVYIFLFVNNFILLAAFSSCAYGKLTNFISKNLNACDLESLKEVYEVMRNKICCIQILVENQLKNQTKKQASQQSAVEVISM